MAPVDDLEEWLKDPKPLNLISELYQEKIKSSKSISNINDTEEIPAYVILFILVIPIYLLLTAVMLYVNIQPDIKTMVYGYWWIFTILFWLEFPSYLQSISLVPDTNLPRWVVIIIYFFTYAPWLYRYRLVPTYYFITTNHNKK